MGQGRAGGRAPRRPRGREAASTEVTLHPPFRGGAGGARLWGLLDELTASAADPLCQRRLVEESDLRAAQELFGGSSGAASSKLDAMLPKTVKDFEEYAQLLAAR